MWSLSDAAPQVYTLDGDGNPMSVDCRPANENMTIVLGVKVPAAGEYELRPDKIQGFSTDAKIYLRDTFTGARTQLTEGSAPYVFTADAPGEYNDRFEIEIDTNRIETGIDDHTNTARYRVFTDVQSCTVTGLQGDATVSIYDVAGRQMLRRHTTANSLEAALPAGPYVVTINENGKNYNVKIIVK